MPEKDRPERVSPDPATTVADRPTTEEDGMRPRTLRHSTAYLAAAALAAPLLPAPPASAAPAPPASAAPA
jgi:hypothetical protein